MNHQSHRHKIPFILGLPAAALLLAAGTVHADPGTTGDPAAGRQVFEQNCVICHGTSGKGDGPGAAALNPKPANFNDHERFSKLDEATRLKAVSEGGAAVGASPFMPPFKEVLTEEQIHDVLAYIRAEFTH
jgi:mono/diheme cytochrome c family protein